MQIKLDIKDDKELRNYMKDYLKGLVTSISREEVGEDITKAAVSKIESLSRYDLKNMIGSNSPEIMEIIRNKVEEFSEEKYTRIVESRIEEIHRNSRAELRDMVKYEMETFKKDFFGNINKIMASSSE